MKAQRYPTRPPILRRIARNRWVVACFIICCIFALHGVAEAGCELVGAGYDPRVGAF